MATEKLEGTKKPDKENPKDALTDEHLDEDLPAELDEAGLDSFLEKEEPEFSKSLLAIGADKKLAAQDISLSDSEQQLADEVAIWQHGHKGRQIVVKLLPFVPKLSLIIKRVRFKLFLFARGLLVRFKNFCYYLATDGRKKAFSVIKHVAAGVLGFFLGGLKDFKAFPVSKKILAVASLFLAVGTAFFIYRSYTQGFFKAEDELFIPSLAAVASEAYDYDPNSESELFYDNLRSTQNLFLIPKMVVNLKRSSQSKSSPMAAFEFFVEGVVPEVIVEMKDREAMIKDAIQRVIEEYSFEQLDTADGKNELREKILRRLNTLLTKGAVRRVLIKTVILKP